MFPNLRKDIRRHIGDNRVTLRRVLYLLFDQGFWAIAVYRFGFWVHNSCKIFLIRQILKVISFFAFKSIEITTGISIPFSAKIGEGFYIGHFGGIIINGRAIIGKYCNIGPGVVIGTKGLGDKGVPIIGDNVFMGTGAKILGQITIGNNARIGANAVVLKDVPDDAIAVGIPAKNILKDNNSNDCLS